MSTSVTNLCLGPIHNVVSCIFPEPATLLLALPGLCTAKDAAQVVGGCRHETPV